MSGEEARHPPVAVITGGKGTLARALRAELASRGWQVLAPGRETLDVADADSTARFFAGLARVDLLVNNAGVRRDAPLARQRETDWDEVVRTGLTGAWRCARAVLPLMRRQGGGHIVSIGSRTALHGVAGQTAYGAAKAGLLALTQSLADEAGPHNIRANAVLPGWIPTRFNEDLPESVHAAVRASHRLGRFNTAEDTARFIAFLHSMPHTSGQVFQLDSRPGLWL